MRRADAVGRTGPSSNHDPQEIEVRATHPSVTFGDPRLPARIWAKTKVSKSGCWLWQGTQRSGYGLCGFNGSTSASVHRVAYQQLVGPITEETIDHLCRVRRCLNPAHLEPVSGKENTLRGFGITARNARKKRCKHGHRLEGYNVVLTYWPPGRKCRKCNYRDCKKWRAKR